ncbi:MAG: hypothetical protein AAF225_14370 [Pseudomonadota bacterium]
MLSVRAILTQSVVPAALIVSTAYQILLGINGPDGMRRAEQLAMVKAERALEVEMLKLERARLEERADRLVLSSLDEDLLEVQARANLGHMRPGEYRISLSELDAVAATPVGHEQQLTSLIAVSLLNTGV